MLKCNLSQVMIKTNRYTVQVRFLRRVHSPYLFYVKWYTITGLQAIKLHLQLLKKQGKPHTKTLMSGSKVSIWEFG